MTPGKLDTRKIVLRRILDVAPRLLMLMSCFAVIFQSTPLPARAQTINLPIGDIVGPRRNESSNDADQSPLHVMPRGADTGESVPTVEGIDAASGSASGNSSSSTNDGLSSAMALSEAVAAFEAAAAPLLEARALAQEIGPDPDALAAWVREETRLLPYLGRLKGPDGVLVDGAGNSLDRAILLIEMLQTHDFEPRLLRRTLPEDTVASLIPLVGHGERGNPPPVLDPAHVSAARQLSETLLPILGDAAAAEVSRSNLDGFRTAPIPALTDHWSVEVMEDGVWVPLALDPVSDSGSDGKDAVVVVPHDPLPESLVHRVRLRVGLKFADEPAEEVFAFTVPADVLAKHSAFFTFAPARRGGGNLFVAQEAAPFERSLQTMAEYISEGFEEAAVPLREVAWIPLLMIEKQALPGRAFTLDGHVLSLEETRSPPSPLQQVTGAIGGALGGIVQGGAPRPEAVEAQKITVWMEIDLLTPSLDGSTEVTTTRRFLAFSAESDPAPEAGFAPAAVVRQLLASHVIGAQTGRGNAVYYALAVAQDLETRVWTPRVIEDAAPDELELSSLPLELDLHMFNALRWAVSPVAGQVFLDRPSMQRVSLTHTPDGTERAFDILSNRVSLLPSQSDTVPSGTEFLTQGIADTIAEALPAWAAGLPVGNAAFASAYQLADGGEPTAAVTIPKDPLARLLAGEGDWRIIAVGSNTEALWLMDVTSGNLVGIDGFARGAAFVDYLLKADKVGIPVAVGVAILYRDQIAPALASLFLHGKCFLLGLTQSECLDYTDPYVSQTPVGPILDNANWPSEFADDVREASEGIDDAARESRANEPETGLPPELLRPPQLTPDQIRDRRAGESRMRNLDEARLRQPELNLQSPLPQVPPAPQPDSIRVLP